MGRPVFAGLRLLGAAAVLGALLALFLPLQLGAVDRGGFRIGCGTGWGADASVAQRMDALNAQQRALAGPAFVASDYAGECAALVADRRVAALAVAAVGLVVLLSTVVEPVAAAANRVGRREGRPDWVNAGVIRSSPA